MKCCIWCVIKMFVWHVFSLFSHVLSPTLNPIDVLGQERHNSIANALELCNSCTNPSTCLCHCYQWWSVLTLFQIFIFLQICTQYIFILFLGLIFWLWNSLFHCILCKWSTIGFHSVMYFLIIPVPGYIMMVCALCLYVSMFLWQWLAGG